MLQPLRLLSVFVISASLSFFAFAAESPSGTVPENCVCKHMSHLAKRLNLDEKQLQQIKEIKAKARASMKMTREQLKSLRIQINNLIMSKTVDTEQLDRLVNQKLILLSQLIKSQVMTRNQIYNSLTPNQQLQFQEMLKKWRAKKETKLNCHCTH